MLQAGLGNLAGKPLGDLRCFGDGAPFGNLAGNVRACCHEPAFLQRLHAQSNRRFVHRGFSQSILLQLKCHQHPPIRFSTKR